MAEISSTLIGLAGPPGAGKGSLANALVELGCETINLGELVRERAQAAGFVPQDSSRNAYLPFYHDVATIEGNDWLARAAHDKQRAIGVPMVVDGLRIPADAGYISQHGLTLYVRGGSLDELFERVQRRKRSDDISTSDLEKYKADTEAFDMEGVAAQSHHFILPMETIHDPQLREDKYREYAHYVLTVLAKADAETVYSLSSQSLDSGVDLDL